MIERLARRRGVRGQFHFASEAKHRIPQRDDFVAAKSHRGLHLLGRGEQALALPLGALRTLYGPQVAIDPVTGGQAIVEVRIGLEKHYLAQVRAALRRRGANPSEEYLGTHYCVLRFQARPAAVLGLPAELARLTAGKASHELVLRAYE